MRMAETAQASNRKLFLDQLRVLATCAVVLVHTVTAIKDTTDMTQFPVAFRVFLAVMDLTTWCVPVFVMISGYLFLNPEREFTWRRMLGKYCCRILLALFLFGVPYACLELVATERILSLSMAGRAFLMVLQGKGWAHMWYLYLVLFLYLITLPLKRILKRIPRWSVYGATAVLFVGSSLLFYGNKVLQRDVFPVLPDICIYIFYYLWGYLFVSWDQKKRRNVVPAWVLGILAAVLAVGMVLNRALASEQIQMAYDYPYTVALSLLLFAWAGRWKCGAGLPCRFWGSAGKLSFAIYLIHPLYINITYKFLGLTPLDYPLWMSLPVFWLVVLALSASTAWLLHRIPLLDKYVL